MNKLFIFFMVAILATLITSCGTIEKAYEKQNFETITNDTGELTLWNGGKVMAYFSKIKVTYSASDSDAMYFKDVPGYRILLRDSGGATFTHIGNGDSWYTSPGVLIKLKDN